MSDEELRALERRFRESGAAEDEARWRAARARAGEVLELRWVLGEEAYGQGARVLTDAVRLLAPVLEPGFAPPETVVSRTDSGLRDLGMGEYSSDLTTRRGDATRGLEVVETMSGISDGLTPTWYAYAVRAYGLAWGRSVEVQASVASPAYARQNLAVLTATGPADRIATLAALARERFAATG